MAESWRDIARGARVSSIIGQASDRELLAELARRGMIILNQGTKEEEETTIKGADKKDLRKLRAWLIGVNGWKA